MRGPRRGRDDARRDDRWVRERGFGASMRAPKSVSTGSGDSSSIERSTGDGRMNRWIAITEATNDTPASMQIATQPEVEIGPRPASLP